MAMQLTAKQAENVKRALAFECDFQIITSRPRPIEITELTFKNEITFKDISAGSNYISSNWGFTNTHIKSAWHLRLKPQRRPIWKKGDIPITQMDGEVKVVGDDRLQSSF
jgi:hypothetical protein